MESSTPRCPPRRRPRLGLHLATWAILGCLAAALVAVQFHADPLIVYEYGWPLTFRSHLDLESFSGSLEYKYLFDRFHWSALELNIGFWLLLLSATAIVVEGWLRQPQRWQLRLGDLMSLVFVVAVMIGEYCGVLNMHQLAERLGITPTRNFWDSPWWVQTPLYFGIGCLIFATGRALFWLGQQSLLGALVIHPPPLERPPV